MSAPLHLAEIFRSVTYEGRIENARLIGNTYRAELWHGDLP
jgi:hypothetical protein